jgi:photosystem II stability/assembly factor-like uncharacterized protein
VVATGDGTTLDQRIAFAPGQPAHLLVPATNLHVRSDDGGRTWSSFRVPGQDAYAIAFDPANAKLVYAGGRGETYHFARSEDGGKTWRQMGRGLEGSQKILLAAPTTPTSLFSVSGATVFKSIDGGASWTRLAGLPTSGTDDIYNLVLDPTEPRTLWAATEKGLFRSGDGGESWSQSDRGTGAYLVRDVAFDPTRAGRMWAATGGTGIYRSDDGGVNWDPAGPLSAAWVGNVWGAPASDASLFAQTSVGLFRRDAAGEWHAVAAPFDDDGDAELDGMLHDRAAPRVLWAYASSRAWRSGDGGATWQELEREEPSMRQLMRGDLTSVQFRSLAQDAGDARVLYAGAWSNDPPGAVFKSTDGGRRWKASGEGLPGESVTQLCAAGPRTVFALLPGHGLFRSADAGATWTAAGAGLPEDGGEVRVVAADPSRPGHLFAAAKAGLFRTRDDGTSWQRLGGALEEEDVEAVAVSPDGTVYAGSFHGVFRSTDGGDTWSSLAEGLPNTDVRSLALHGGRLWAGTAGNGVWSRELP